MYSPIQRKRIYIEVAEQIVSMIREGKIKQEQKLSTERELSLLFGVSRASVREALSALEFMGVVESRVGDGTYISRTAAAPARGMALLSDQHSPQDIIQARIMIEPLGAALAAENRTESDLMGLHLKLREMEVRWQENQPNPEPDHQFHLIVASASQNLVYESIVRFIFSLTGETLWQLLKDPVEQDPEYQRTYLRHHADILSAIENRDSIAAKEAMYRHLVQVEKDIFRD